MEITIYHDYTELSANTAEQIASVIKEKPDALLCFPAGETSVGTFKQLVELYKTGKLSFRHCRIVGLDEWAHIGDMKSENCLSFMRKHLFDHIDYSKENFCFFDGESPDLQNECIKTDKFIRDNGPVDMLLLGVGMNGHLGLNEPGTPWDKYSHIVELEATTKTVAGKYFSGKVTFKQGITLGMKFIMEAKTVILQMNGIKKAPVVRQLIDSEVTPAFPASAAKSHSNSFLLLDKEAAKYL
jgi:glucosamine-6-phosphate isomerase